jgi:hypothetical protein
MTTVVKGKVLRQDAEHWDGVVKTASRKDQTGGTITGLVFGYEVDVLASYGNGENYTLQTIKDCVRRIGSASVTLIFNPGTWVIDDDLTIGSNFVCRLPAGAVFSVSSGKTLTFSGPVYHDAQTWTSGSGTVTENGTRYLTGKLDLTGAVLQGTGALVFEGSGDDAFETTLSVTNPTADRTITIPDADINLGAIPSLTGNNTYSGNNTHTGTNTFTDSLLIIADESDSTKKVQFQVSGVTTATTRTLTVPNQNSTLVVQGDAATQAEQVTASAVDKFTSPGRQHYHPGAPKYVGKLTNLGGLPVITSLYNALGALTPSRTGTGDHTLTWTNVLTGPIAIVTLEGESVNGRGSMVRPAGLTTTSVRISSLAHDNTFVDGNAIYITLYGTLP